jgi:hypothetical protein
MRFCAEKSKIPEKWGGFTFKGLLVVIITERLEVSEGESG